jgi:putative ABC transport system ATP-binding protein
VNSKVVLEVRALTRRYRAGREPVLDGIDFVLGHGEYVAIMGESGVGKSTLLNLLAGLDRPDGGQILFMGQDLTALDDDALTVLRRRSFGFVFQAFHVLTYLSVRQNVALPLELLGVDAAAIARRVDEMLAATGIAELGARYAYELSGGELQRVAIARALVHRPALLLADEPTGNLDPRTAATILALLREQLRAAGGAGLLITHSEAAAATADRVLRLDGRSLTPLARGVHPA